MGKYKDGSIDWWVKPTILLDESPCGQECPPDGKYFFLLRTEPAIHC